MQALYAERDVSNILHVIQTAFSLKTTELNH